MVSVRDLMMPGFLAPAAVYRAMASTSFLRAAPVPRSAPLMASCSRSRRVLSSRSRSASSSWRTAAVERKNFSEGMPVRSASRRSTSAGSVIDSPPMISSTLPLAPAKILASEPSTPSSSVKSMRTVGGASSGAPHRRRPSTSWPAAVTLRKRPYSMARSMVVLPASLGPRTMVRPGANSRSRSAWRWRSVSRSRLSRIRRP